MKDAETYRRATVASSPTRTEIGLALTAPHAPPPSGSIAIARTRSLTGNPPLVSDPFPASRSGAAKPPPALRQP